MSDARVRAQRKLEEKRKNDPKFKRTPLWLLPEDVAMMDSLGRRLGAKDRMDTLRRLIEIGLGEIRKTRR